MNSHYLATGISSAFHLYPPESSSVCNVLLTQVTETTVHTSKVREVPPVSEHGASSLDHLNGREKECSLRSRKALCSDLYLCRVYG